jgi:hypothetical protein
VFIQADLDSGWLEEEGLGDTPRPSPEDKVCQALSQREVAQSAEPFCFGSRETGWAGPWAGLPEHGGGRGRTRRIGRLRAEGGAKWGAERNLSLLEAPRMQRSSPRTISHTAAMRPVQLLRFSISEECS